MCPCGTVWAVWHGGVGMFSSEVRCNLAYTARWSYLKGRVACNKKMTSTTADGGAAYAFKVIIVGDSNVGKTSIVHRFLYAERPPHVHLTVGVDFGIRNVAVGDVRIKLQLWDTAGQEMYRSIASAYYRNSAGCIAMFDLTNQRSFQSLHQWIADIGHAAPGARCIVVGNKKDLSDKRVVDATTARALASSFGAEYAETSVCDGRSVNHIFQTLTARIYAELVVPTDATSSVGGITILRPPPVSHKGRSCQCKG